jgi:hypothetical protein
MRLIPSIAITGAIVAGTTSLALLSAPRIAAQPIPSASAGELRPASSFAGIPDPRARAVALFQEASKVLQHPRCVNCHPRQTDRMRPHQPLVVRGTDGRGVSTLPCNTCHGSANFDPAHVPGHPEWHLAPVSMAWEGRSLGQICEQIKDRERNGGSQHGGPSASPQ